MSEKGGLLLTAEQIENAPVEVRRWLRGVQLESEAHRRKLEYGQIRQVFPHGLAICGVLEIKNLILALSENYLALQVFFEFGHGNNDLQSEHTRAGILKFSDFKHHTDIGDLQSLRRCVYDINEALQNLRDDPQTIICRIADHDSYHVHRITQVKIYGFWRRLARLAERRPEIVPFPMRLARTLDGRANPFDSR